MTPIPLPMAAFVAGAVSFLSPCVLPLVPGYVSIISSASADGGEAGSRRVGNLAHAGLFVLGFSVVFITLGAAAGALGQVAGRHIGALETISGAVVILFGLHMAGVLNIPALNSDLRAHRLMSAGGPARSLLTGFAFGFGWTPCVGPILAGVLALAASQSTSARGALLLSVYSAGLAIPFLLTALSIERFLATYKRARRPLRFINIASGLLLVATGALLMTHRINILSAWMNQIPLFHWMSERLL